MKVRIAENAGFCFGAKRATDMAEAAIKGEGRLFTLGRLVHNDVYNAYLKEQGVREISAEDFSEVEALLEKGEKITVLIRAHGEQNDALERLHQMERIYEDLTVLDGTCPYVCKLRRIAAENSGEGKFFLLIGAESHPEVRGVMSCCRGEGLVLADSRALEDYLFSEDGSKIGEKQISMAVQTTQNLNEWKKCWEILKKVYTNAIIFDTICSVTEKRQAEAASLAASSDVMLVIGSRASSNTMKLYELCQEKCPRTYLVESARDARGITLGAADQLSITAGASTPSSLIQEVKQTMSEQMENFEALLEQSMKTLNTGDIVEGVITSVSSNEVHLDLGAKTTGVIVRDKLVDDPSAKLTDLFKVGDVIKAKVVKVSDIDGIATLDRKSVV